jgi:transcriptional/translational regulatory protein YebC/TACO1
MVTNATETAVKTVKKPDLNKESIKKAIAKGKEVLKSGKTKADAAREIYPLVKDESREVIVQVFMQGATLTERGAMTYFYNIKRKLGQEK